MESPTEDLLPQLNLNVNLSTETPKEELVKPEQLVSCYTNILSDITENTKEIDETLKNFIEMVMNEGDATTSSKEAVVNLLKMKADQVDKKTKVFDLLMRAHLKETDQFPRYMVKQENTIKVEGSRKGKLLKAIAKENNADQ